MTSSRRGGSALRVLTFNVGNGLAGPGELTAMLRAGGWDLVALQEVSESQGRALEREISDSYPHRVIHARGVAGKALLSKHPIADPQELLFPCGRAHLRADVEVSGRKLQVLVAHVPLEHAAFSLFGPAAREVDLLAERAMASTPSLLVGDFNKTPFSLLYRRLRRHGLLDAFREVGMGCGFTFPIFGRYKRIPLPPLVRIDYVWHTSDLRAIRCRTGPDGGSDHLPLQAELEF
jgi:endonuclease/exonuclease/phosphatase family metal-dependent hydrolase